MAQPGKAGTDTVDIGELLRQKSGIRLDIGCGRAKQPGFVGMDAQELEGVDIVHDWNDYPWPLPDESCVLIMASHVVEHVNPADGGFIRWMDEVWRIMQVDGQLAISCPHGYSPGYLQDPTHCNQVNETTWAYFDPGTNLYGIYRPKPWRVTHLSFNPAANIEVVLVKVSDDQEEAGNGES